MTPETIAPLGDDPAVSLPAIASCLTPAQAGETWWPHFRYTTPRDTITRLGSWSLAHEVSAEKLALLTANFENARFDRVLLDGAGLRGPTSQV
jgi:hypothetical protein